MERRMTGEIVSVAIRVCEVPGPGVGQSCSVRTVVFVEFEVRIVPVVGSAISPVMLGGDRGIREFIDHGDVS